MRDDALLRDEYAPITDEIGFVEMPAELVRDWLATVAGDDLADVTTISGNLRAALDELLPLRTFRTRRLVVPTDSSWTAIFDDTWRGTDAALVTVSAADELGCRSLRIVAVTDEAR